MMGRLLSLFLAVTVASAAAKTSDSQQLQPSCESKVYCDSELLHHVQLAALYNDSKTFVDKRLLASEEQILKEFSSLLEKTNNAPSRDQLIKFVDEHMASGNELEAWTPPDFTEEPEFLERVKDPVLKKFAKDVNAIWPSLGRRVRSEVSEAPDRFSLIPLPNGFVVPGGRFKEIYYWDSYWIIEGLIICGMEKTSRGMIDNLISLVKKKNHVPNGSRVYYDQRSQPPLLIAMARLYFEATGDLEWLRNNIDILEKELQFWIANRTVNVGRYTLLRYNAPSEGPRPESYKEDYESARDGRFTTEAERQQFYTDIKSAAESGWDFSSRWFSDVEHGNLSSIRTTNVIPVDLNAIFAGALRTMSDFQTKLGNARSAVKYRWLSARWIYAIERVLWNIKDGIWYDFDIESSTHRKYFFPSNLSPLWADAVQPLLVRDKGRRVYNYILKSKSIDYAGGVPTSLYFTNEQWDFPNGWPPLQSMIVGALDNSGYDPAKKLALKLASVWVRSNYGAFNKTGSMYEKYNVETSGSAGQGGEYEVQDGFGWSNGVVFEFLNKYGDVMTLADEGDDDESVRVLEKSNDSSGNSSEEKSKSEEH